MLTEYSYAFSLWLEAKAYTPTTIERYRQLLVSFEEFLRSDGVTDLNEIRQDHPEGFSRARERKYQEAFGRPISPTYLRSFRSSAELILDFLRTEGVIAPQPATPPPEGPFSQEQMAHAAALERSGRLGPSALKIRRHWVKQFCLFLYERGVTSLAQLSPAVLYDFLLVTAEGKAPSTISQLNAALKDFLRFAFDNQWTPKDFSPYLLRVNTYQEQKLPNYLSRDEIQTALARIDIHRPGSFKLKAILTLLASYGLRIGEVAQLTFSNIDWSHKQFVLPHRKNNEPLILPLTPEAATALGNYILHQRPRNVPYSHIFLTTRRPRPYRSGAHLAHVVNKQIKLLGLEASTRTFRHSFAKQLIDQAVPLKTIQELMGHCSIDSTRIYARIDIQALREVAENDSLDL